jgi:peptide/nickel transport system substrate-binding protein
MRFARGSRFKRSTTIKHITLSVTFILLVFLFVACGNAENTPTPSGAEPTRLIYGLTLAPSGIDPHVNASSELGIPLTGVYDTLVYQDPDTGEFIPGLAERWDISDDGQIYTFYLRRDVTFHDGTPFNAAAVQVNLERIANPDTASQKAVFMLGPYQRTAVVDDYTVQIHLSRPYAPLLDALSQVYLGMASPAALERWGADYQFHQVGSGPFEFVAYVPNDHLTLARNPDYAWGPPLFEHQGPPYLDQVEFRFLVDAATRAPALETGEVDVMGEVPPRDAVRLDESDVFVLHAVPIPGQPAQFFFNTQLAPLDDLAVRQALLYATDRETIVRTIFLDTSPVAYGPLSAATRSYDPTVRDFYPYDRDQAAALLDETGWRDSDGDGVRDRDGLPLQLTMALGGWGFNPDMAQLLQAQWAQLGVQLDAEVMPYPALLEAGQSGSHHLVGFNLFGRDPNLLWTFYHRAGGFNFSHVADLGLDALLDQAAAVTGPERDPVYAQIQGYIMEQALVLPIRDYVNLNVARAAVKGLRFDAQGWFPWLANVTLDPQ